MAEWNETELAKVRGKLRCKVQYHLGRFCSDVEDVVQETMMRFLDASREPGTRIENPGAFLNGICNNVIREYRRRIWRDGTDVPEPVEAADPRMSEAEQLAVREAVDVALGQLSARDRAVLRGILLEGRTPAEVARQTSIAESHVRVVLFRAKDRFRKIYLNGHQE